MRTTLAKRMRLLRQLHRGQLRRVQLHLDATAAAASGPLKKYSLQPPLRNALRNCLSFGGLSALAYGA